MHERRTPEWLRHAPTPGMRGFARLAGLEAMARGILVSAFPLAVYETLGDARAVSGWYFAIGLASFTTGLLVPWLNRFVPRRWIYATAALTFAAGALCAAAGGWLTLVGLAMITLATVALFVCFNAYVLDYVARTELGRQETLRLFYSAVGWTTGPALGVWLMGIWRPAPFLIAAAAALCLLALFLYMRLGNGKLITRARAPAPNPLAYLPRFFAQPRLVAGWSFAVVRSCGWWVYVVYLPIFAIENGLGEHIGGVLVSLANAGLFGAPLMLRLVHWRGVRGAVRTGFLGAATCFGLAWAVQGAPLLAVLALGCGSLFLVLLDVSGGLPFLLAVKPSERTEMSAVYSSFRDVSGILTPGVAWLVLFAAPLPAIFAAASGALAGCWWLAGGLHPRLGHGPARVSES